MTTSVPWGIAQQLAALQSSAGLPGHLATIESSQEYSYLVNNVLGPNVVDVWIAGEQLG